MGKIMTEEKGASTSVWDNKTLIIAVVVVVLVVLIMYFYDQKQQRAYELRCLERRVELLEEWENRQGQLPPSSGKRFKRKSYVQ